MEGAGEEGAGPPVLTKKSRPCISRMHAARLSEVRRSSSISPSLIVSSGRPSTCAYVRGYVSTWVVSA